MQGLVKPWAESVLLSSAGIVVGREGRQSEWGVFPAGSFWLGAQALECPPPSARPASPPQPPPPPQKQLLRNTAPPRPAALLPNVKLFPTAPPPEDRPQGLASGLGGHSLHRKQDLWKLPPSHWTSSAKYTVFRHTPHVLPPPQFGILEVDTEKRMDFPGRRRP